MELFQRGRTGQVDGVKRVESDYGIHPGPPDLRYVPLRQATSDRVALSCRRLPVSGGALADPHDQLRVILWRKSRTAAPGPPASALLRVRLGRVYHLQLCSDVRPRAPSAV